MGLDPISERMGGEEVDGIPPGLACDLVVDKGKRRSELEVALPDVHCCVLALSFGEIPKIVKNLEKEMRKRRQEQERNQTS